MFGCSVTKEKRTTIPDERAPEALGRVGNPILCGWVKPFIMNTLVECATYSERGVTMTGCSGKLQLFSTRGYSQQREGV